MARINLDDSLWLDDRYYHLCKLEGKKQYATGAIVEAFKIGQRYWSEGKQLIPKKVWEIHELSNNLVLCGLVIEHENGFYVCGSENYFTWLAERKESGRKGGLQRAANSKNNDLSLAQLKLSLSSGQAEVKPLTHTHTLTQTNTSFKECREHEIAVAIAPPPVKTKRPKKEIPPGYTKETFNAYKQAFLERYKFEPLKPNQKENGILTKFIKKVGLENAPAIAKFYVESNDKFYIQKAHSISTLLSQCESIRNIYLAGGIPSNSEIKSNEIRNSLLSEHENTMLERWGRA